MDYDKTVIDLGDKERFLYYIYYRMLNASTREKRLKHIEIADDMLDEHSWHAGHDPV